MKAFVVGMHRSGTSAVMRVLRAIGADYGREQDLMAAADSNPFGHFELTEFVAFNDELLRSVGSHWMAPVHSNAQMAAVATPRTVAKARAMVADLELGADVVVKDPRFCLTLPFWRAAGMDARKIVVPLRHPKSVALSLQARNGLDLEYGHGLWETYHRYLLSSAVGCDIVPVAFGDLLERPNKIVRLLADELAIESSEAQLAAAATAVEPQASHSSFDPADLDGLSPSTIEIWDLLLGLGSGVLAETTAEAGVSPLCLGAAQGLATGATRADELERERDEARVALEAAAGRFDRERSEERERFAELRLRFDQLSLDIEIGHRAALEAARRTGNELGRLQEQRDRAVRRAGELEREHDTVVRRSESLTREHGQRLEHLRDVEVERDRYRRDAETIRNSRAGSLVYQWWGVRNRLRSLHGRVTDRNSAPESSRPDARIPEPVHFDPPAAPRVSIVVPVHGELEFTARCLRSILETPTELAYEVIVVDDLSPDATPEWLGQCSGIGLISNETNLGFLRSTNAGAARASGSLLVLLNNDTEVHPGWLDALVELVDTNDDVGAVGAKLVYPDGSLQEAGAIIWSDGFGWNWGKGDDPRGYEYNFVREVDYCSAACLLVRKDLWDRVGGFDERYVPAYYEDPDLAFALRELGYRVLYQPAAVVTHFEGVSHGTDESVGLKAHQVVNRDRFAEKWAATLAEHHPSTGDPRLASWRGAGKRIVIFDHEVPAWDQDAGSVRISAVIDLLIEMGFRVSVVPHNRHRREPYSSRLEARGVEVVHGHADWHDLLRRLAPDLGAVIVCRPGVAVDVVPIVSQAAPAVPILYDMVDFHGLRIKRRSEQTNIDELRHGQVIAELEMAMVRAADVTIAVTEVEAALVRDHEPDAVVVVLPTIHQAPRSTAPFDERQGVLFIGSWRHLPNRDAIEFLCREIMPLVWQRAPDITLHLVGSDIPVDDWSDVDARIIPVGWVRDLDPFFDQVRCTVAPVRFGAGMKGKVGDSLIRGVPVVTTPVGAEGFEDVARSLLVGESAEELAAHMISAHSDADLWHELSDRGHQEIRDHFGYPAAREALRDLLVEAGVPLPQQERPVST